MSDRPHARQKTASTGSAKVERRGNGLGTGPAGNRTGSSSGPAIPIGGTQQQSQGGGGTRGRTVGGGSIILIVIILFVLFSRGEFIGESVINDTASTEITGSQGDAYQDISGGSSGSSSLFGGGSYGNTLSATNDADVDRTVSPSAREKYTALKGDGKDYATVMVYICGSNLESDNGMATSDLNEMASAALDNNNVHVVVETGGAKKWRNSVIKAGNLGRYEVVSGGIKPLETDLPSRAMTEPQVLTDFIKFSVNKFPADRYMLILWDHGGGSVSGFGYDELFPNGSMRLDGVAKAVKDSGVKFDFIGFDACLMAGMETAIALEPYSDYLIASEETEPGTGWYYTNWLSKLSADPSTATTDLGKQIIDDFIQHSTTSSRSKTTLSLTDLADFAGVFPASLAAFGQEISAEIDSDNYQNVARARADSKEFSSKIDQVDLVDFCGKLGSAEAEKLSDAVKQCVKYNRTANVSNAWGMSAYFPYSSLKSMKSMTEIYDNISMDESYSASVKSFATLGSSGQIASTSSHGGSGSLMGSLMSGSMSSSSFGSGDLTSLLMQAMLSGASARDIPANAVETAYEPGYPGGSTDYSSILGGADWVSESDVAQAASYVAAHSLNGADLSFIEKDDEQVLSLTEDQWKTVNTVELSVFYDEGGRGFVDLGLDNVFEYNEDGDLIASYDGTWLSINSNICSYYMTSDEYGEDESYVTEGYSPAMVNGQRGNIILQFTDQEPEGTVLGYRRVNQNGTVEKGLTEFKPDDTIELLCDYYDVSGSFDDCYYLGQPFTAGEELEVSMKDIEGGSFRYGYRLTDIYGNHYFTEMAK